MTKDFFSKNTSASTIIDNYAWIFEFVVDISRMMSMKDCSFMCLRK